MVEVLRFKGQVGCPPSVAADAQLGFSATGYQSAELLFERREGGGHILLRLEGTYSRAHEAGKETEMSQRAKAGCCPCCAKPTHIAAPSRCVVGGYSPRKARRVSLWKEHGPWAARSSAASLYAQVWAYLSSAWDWAAEPLDVRAPPLFDGAFGAAQAPSPAVTPPSTQGASDKNSRLLAT